MPNRVEQDCSAGWRRTKLWLRVALAPVLASASLCAGAVELAPLPDSLDLGIVRAIPVQHDGRWPPLDTVARDIVESVTGEEFFEEHDPVLLLLAWTFDAETWRSQPLIPIRNAELRGELALSATQTVFSHDELVGHDRFLEEIRKLAHIERGRKPNPLESKVSDILKKLETLRDVFTGSVIRPVPDAKAPLGRWTAIPERPADANEALRSAQTPWAELGRAFLANDRDGFFRASEHLRDALAGLPTAHRPDPKRIATELRFNRLQPFRTAWQVMVIGAVLAGLALAIRRKWFDVIAILAMVAGFALLTYGLSLRWQIAGRIPAANMFESLLFLSWGMGAFAIVSMVLVRDRVVPLTASFMGAVSLALADILPLDHFVRPIVPVLRDTIWMSIHVPIIMVSYSVLALAVLIAHAQIAVMAVAPARKRLVAAIDAMHYWYMHVGSIVLLAGIATGSMWAASSWGRYWGWDPKEVWSLIALLGYLTILHIRVDRFTPPKWAYGVGVLLAVAVFVLVAAKLEPLTVVKRLALVGAAVAGVFFVLTRGRFAAAVKSILAFWLIVMTYVGVNYVLGIGLHSYGFGTGAVSKWMFRVGAIDLALVAVCAVAYLARRAGGPATGTEPPQAVPG